MNIHPIIAFSSAFILTVITVGVHYEFLNRCSRFLGNKELKRYHVLFAVFSGLAAHILEIFIFAIGWYIAIQNDWMALSVENVTFMDAVYFSFSTFTTIGYGDVVPTGPCRILAGFEGLVGLVLITWTTSFTYFIMKKSWN